MKEFTQKNSLKEINKVMKYQLSQNQDYMEIEMLGLIDKLANVHRFYRICGLSKTQALIRAIHDYKTDIDEFIEIGNMADFPICF